MKIDDTQSEDLLENAMAREIVQEIMKFGVSQPQILQIINLLALELEDNTTMKAIRQLIEDSKKTPLEVIHV